MGPPKNRMGIAVLSLVGFFISFYLLAHHLGWTGELLCGVGDCGAVQSSKYAKIGSIPVSAFGMVGYIVLLALSMTGLQPGRDHAPVIGGLLLAGSSIGVAYSAYLTYLEAFVIHAWCQWCVISAILMTLIFFASLQEIGRMRGTAQEDGGE